MQTTSQALFKLLNLSTISALLAASIWYASPVQAAQGCGYNYHMTVLGRCVPNSPGPYARLVPGRPDCWINSSGNLRCYR